ncbi:MAG: DinB family protein [Gemmatimonadota bacterium]
MFRRMLMLAAVAAFAAPATARGQTVSESLQGLYEITRDNVIASAQLLDEELYSFRPTEEVRSMGELFAHLANSQYAFCSAAAGERNPATENFEGRRNTKTSILEALEAGFGYCDGVFAGMTDARGAEPVQFFTGPNTVFGVLAFNAAHNYEHYGNLVTYMRINGIVPPSSR